MIPDFSKTTVDTLAKRAAYLCSNPDCRISTSGPNSDPEKATVLGEAAHIFGARKKSKRFNPSMTDTTRAEITNGIWLCRNCHKRIDSDEEDFSSVLLFAWRQQHENYVLAELGSNSDRLRLDEQSLKLEPFEQYPALIQRIVIDKPPGWEYRLTAELMRFLNKPFLRKLDDLRDGLYLKPLIHIDDEGALDWVRERVSEMSRMAPPMEGLIKRLNASWGAEHLCQMVLHEEDIHFAVLPDRYQRIVNHLKDTTGSQASKLAEVPKFMDEVVATIPEAQSGHSKENPKIVERVITFTVPDDWADKLDAELKKAFKHSYRKGETSETSSSLGLVWWFIFAFIIIWILL